MRAIVVVQDGRIIAETYGEGFSASTPLLGWSMTKTVNAALAGAAIKDGKLSLDPKKPISAAGQRRACGHLGGRSDRYNKRIETE